MQPKFHFAIILNPIRPLSILCIFVQKETIAHNFEQ